jgi:hypothetical protein
MAKWTVPETRHGLKNSVRGTLGQHVRKMTPPSTPNVAQQNDRQLPARPAPVGAAAIRTTDVRYNDAARSNANVAPVAFTETFLVVVEGFDNSFANQPVYQIQMWRVTVLHQAIDSGSNKVNPKQT